MRGCSRSRDAASKLSSGEQVPGPIRVSARYALHLHSMQQAVWAPRATAVAISTLCCQSFTVHATMRLSVDSQVRQLAQARPLHRITADESLRERSRSRARRDLHDPAARAAGGVPCVSTSPQPVGDAVRIRRGRRVGARGHHGDGARVFRRAVHALPAVRPTSRLLVAPDHGLRPDRRDGDGLPS